MDAETFKILSNALQSPEPIKELLTQTLNLMIETEFENHIGASRGSRTETRKGYRCGYRTRHLNTVCGTLELKIPHPQKGGFTPSFLPKHKRFDESLKKTVKEAYVNGVSTGKMDALVKSMGVKGISKGQVTRITSELNETTYSFRTRSLKGLRYPVLYFDATFQKVFIEGKMSMAAIMTVIGTDAEGHREVLALDPFPDESYDSYSRLIVSLLARGLEAPQMIVSDGAAGLLKAMSILLPETKWQRCRVHFVRNVMQTIKKQDKTIIGQKLKRIWHTADPKKAKARADWIIRCYKKQYPTAMNCLKMGLQDTLTCLEFPEFNSRKIATSNVVERLNSDFRRRTKSIGAFPNIKSCVKLLTTIAMNYTYGHCQQADSEPTEDLSTMPEPFGSHLEMYSNLNTATSQ